jgi:hypothetical protein
MKSCIPRGPEQTFLVIPSHVFMILSFPPIIVAVASAARTELVVCTNMHSSCFLSFATGIHTHTRYTRFVLSSIVSCSFSSTVADLLYRVLALILFRPWDFHGRCETGLTLHHSHWSYSSGEITNGIITLEYTLQWQEKRFMQVDKGA